MGREMGKGRDCYKIYKKIKGKVRERNERKSSSGGEKNEKQEGTGKGRRPKTRKRTRKKQRTIRNWKNRKGGEDRRQFLLEDVMTRGGWRGER